ncbi:MAG TPA: cyclic nucleotide-binding domain-containing protein [Candidatus Sulfotelmatobacter sp.]|jgi:CRP-like cAMP-binding protein|nr:cyclic nucleotide-binding domain-containing protein [Candidatus Sulfotelmatobacter sp.]
MQVTPADLTVLRCSPMLETMDETAFSALVGQGKIRAVHRGEALFHQGDAAQSLFVVLEGCLKVYRTSSEGVVTVRRIAETSDTLAEASAFIGGRYAAGAEAVWDSRLLELSADAVLMAFATSPALARSVAVLLSQRLERQMQELESAYWASAPQRLAAFLAEMFDADAGEVDTRLAFDKNVLAARLGMTPETLSRAFLALKDKGVRTHNRCVYIEDAQRLREFAALDDGGLY